MSNLITKTTELAMAITLTYINPGDTVVDATCGNGLDTLALARAAGPAGTVYAFDIQKKALLLTEAKLHTRGFRNTHLLHASFRTMGSHIAPESASAVVFNLGYLPGGDKSITTAQEETLAGLEAAQKVLRPGGILTVTLYDGHPGGAAEKAAVLSWAEALDPRRWHVAFVRQLNQQNHPPEILWLTRK